MIIRYYSISVGWNIFLIYIPVLATMSRSSPVGVDSFIVILQSSSGVATKGLGGAVPRGPQAQGALESLLKNFNRTLLKISPIFKINMTGNSSTLIMATQLWVAELNAALYLDTRAKKWKYKSHPVDCTFPLSAPMPQLASCKLM